MGLASCMGEEPLNMECDIEEATLQIPNPTDVFYHDYEQHQTILSSADSIRYVARPYATLGAYPLSLSLTPGATAYWGTSTEPFRNGTVVDFSGNQRQHFRVVSEDGRWERQYRIFIDNELPSEGNMTFDFSDYELESAGQKYYIWNAEGPAANVFTDGVWKNGNPGFKLSKSSAKPMEYPSVPMVGQGPDGSDCVKLETRDTGAFGTMVNMRLASGSMFNGVFDVANALKDALKATQFGSPFKFEPLSVSADLRFIPGERFQDRDGKTVEGVIDEPDFYIVMYRNTDAEGHQIVIDGNDCLTNPNIIGMARLPHHVAADGSDLLSNEPIHGLTAEWQKVTLNMEYTQEVDPDILASNGYSFYIGFASSWQGAYFRGAVGSQLWIDNVQLICK